MSELSVEDQRALAASLFPHEWNRALCATGAYGQKARARLRQRAVYEHQMIPLRAAGANCGSCLHFGKVPMSRDRCCDLDSDFRGYAIRSANDLCPNYDARP